MSSNGRYFDAREAFAYVDTYRSGILKTAEILHEEKEKLDKRYWETKSADPVLVAELRAVEHAIRHVIKGEEPGLVTLGDAPPVEGESGGSAELRECQEVVSQLSGQRNLLDQKVKQLRNQGQELQAEVIRARQQSQILQRRLVQSNSTFVVVVATMFLVIVVQLYLFWSR
jgi:hypothetical protein